MNDFDLSMDDPKFDVTSGIDCMIVYGGVRLHRLLWLCWSWFCLTLYCIFCLGMWP